MSSPEQYEESHQRALAERLAPFVGQRVGVAVSGGSDSRALLELMSLWAKQTDSTILVATVDHGLRTEAKAEAQSVGAICHSKELDHTTLHWENWNQKGNLQAEARRARYRLLARWAIDKKLAGVALGHTADDVAETFFMRLSRAAGVEGLARMQGHFRRNGVVFLRPILGAQRAELRQFLSVREISWIDDPSNQDTQFDRVKMRQALVGFTDLGLSVAKISQTAENLEMAANALRFYAAQEAKRVAVVVDDHVELEYLKFQALPDEIQRRLLNAVISFVATPEFAPRSKSLIRVMEQLPKQKTSTLAGCILSLKNNVLSVFREPTSVETEVLCPPSGPVEWDGRWRISGQFETGTVVRALGEGGLLQYPDWRETGRARFSLLSSPSIWRGKYLISAPLAERSTKFGAEPLRNKEDFVRILLSH